MRWSRQHPLITLSIPVFLVWLIATLASSDTSPQAPVQATQAASVNTRVVTPESTARPAAFEISPPATPPISISGTYIGTVHNRTANLSSTFIVVMHQGRAGVLDGCVEVKPPLYGSGVLSGTSSGSHVNFSVADITFNGDASKNAIRGSYVVSRQDGRQVGDFRLSEQTGAKESYGCAKGAVLELETSITPTLRTSDIDLHNNSNSTVDTTNTIATNSKFPVETGVSAPARSDLSQLTPDEQQSIRSVCYGAKISEGPAAYNRCLISQLNMSAAGPREPDLSRLTPDEQQSIRSVCYGAKISQGPAAYNRCLISQLHELGNRP
jgi:hypothetical protein